MDIKEFISFIPAILMLIIFLFFLGKNKYVKSIKAGPLEYVAKDTHTDILCKGNIQEKHEKELAEIKQLLLQHINQWEKKQSDSDKMIINIALRACIAVICNPSAPILEKFDTAIFYFKLHGNGNIREQVIKIICEDKQNITIWKSALAKDMKDNGLCEDRYFLGTIKWIESRIA